MFLHCHIRLLPWCISSASNPGAIPICYMIEALATTMQQRADAPVAATATEPKGPQALASMQAVLHIKLRLHLFPFFPHQTFPLLALPQSGTHSLSSLSIPCTKSGITPPMVHLTIDLVRGTVLKLQRQMSAVGTPLQRAKGSCPDHHQRHPTMTQ